MGEPQATSSPLSVFPSLQKGRSRCSEVPAQVPGSPFLLLAAPPSEASKGLNPSLIFPEASVLPGPQAPRTLARVLTGALGAGQSTPELSLVPLPW